MDEAFIAAVNTIGNGQYVPLAQFRESLDVKSYFLKTLLKPVWSEETLVTYFQCRAEDWDFDEKARGIKVRTDLDKQIIATNREKRRTMQLPTALYTAVLKASNTAETAAVIAAAREVELGALPIDCFEALLKALETPVAAPTTPQEQLLHNMLINNHAMAQVKCLVAIPTSLLKKGGGLSQLMEFFNLVAKFGGDGTIVPIDPRVAQQKVVTLKELCDSAAELIKAKGIDKCSVRLIYTLCLVAPFHIMALAISSLGDKGDGEDVGACASNIGKISVAAMEGLSRDTLLKLAIACSKSKAIASEVTVRVAMAAGSSLAAWNMDDMTKLLMAISKAKAGADSSQVSDLFGRAAESVAGKLDTISDTHLIKVVLALGKVASMKDFLEAAAAEAVKRMPNIALPQLLFLTQGFLPLGGSDSSLTQMLDFWAKAPEDAKPPLTADQWAQFAKAVAPVAPTHAEFWKAIGKRLEAGKRTLSDAGKAHLEAAFPEGAGPEFDGKEAFLKSLKPKPKEEPRKSSAAGGRSRSRGRNDDRRGDDRRGDKGRDDRGGRGGGGAVAALRDAGALKQDTRSQRDRERDRRDSRDRGGGREDRGDRGRR